MKVPHFKYYIKTVTREVEEVIGTSWRVSENVLVIYMGDEVNMVFSLANLIYFWSEICEAPDHKEQ